MNKTDRDLLLWAAKAVGLSIDEGVMIKTGHLLATSKDAKQPFFWNPFDDDGDALRLAVRLRIDLLLWIYTDSVLAQTSIGAGRGIPLQGEYVRPVNDHKEPKGNDPYAATRRAIVRAAAEIGRNMK